MAEAGFAAQLLESARRDLTVWRKLAGDTEIHDSALGVHAQQAVEKALKAVLANALVPVRKTHDIAELLDTIDAAVLAPPPDADNLDRLNPYAVEARYGFPSAGTLDRNVVGKQVEAVVTWASALIEKDTP